MATIFLSELSNVGSQLFQDSESFLNDMSDLDSISGSYDSGFSNYSGYTKLIEGYVITYAIDQIVYLAKSFSSYDNSNG
ncbi:hypothetical protein FNW02_00835 [Komarekiella sp. 'clone 1']|uniref:Uncharacterized protein n=1 Tax=Komarekiella delphini-convector SJRDD-AB1 TaxID=2593771 RepID=A0AA40SSJ1_9NOST|nr:hypothetical protein [Komarekiella delphini-convector]MBD6614456.1 hypothetical protein [Komarekiella delphini-convector SJRDD-AB1]